MPALTPVVDSLDKVPEAARSFYEPKEGKFVLSLDATPAGFVPASELAAANGKVVEFRDNNIRLTNEVTELRPLKEQFAGIDPVKAKEAIAAKDALEKKGVKGADDVTTLVQNAIDAALKPVKEQLASSQAQTAAERKRADDSVMRSQITEKFLKAGGKAKAVDFVVTQAASVFKVEGGEVKALPNKFSADHPGDPLGIEEWVVSFAKENDFAFGASSGGGAEPARSGSTRPAGQLVLRDPTPQQLGDEKTAQQIRKGELRIEYTTK